MHDAWTRYMVSIQNRRKTIGVLLGVGATKEDLLRNRKKRRHLIIIQKLQKKAVTSKSHFHAPLCFGNLPSDFSVLRK